MLTKEEKDDIILELLAVANIFFERLVSEC